MFTLKKQSKCQYKKLNILINLKVNSEATLLNLLNKKKKFIEMGNSQRLKKFKSSFTLNQIKKNSKVNHTLKNIIKLRT